MRPFKIGDRVRVQGHTETLIVTRAEEIDTFGQNRCSVSFGEAISVGPGCMHTGFWCVTEIMELVDATNDLR